MDWNFSGLLSPQTVSGSYETGTGGCFTGGKAAGAWSYTSTALYVYRAWRCIKYRDNFDFRRQWNRVRRSGVALVDKTLYRKIEFSSVCDDCQKHI
jgi:hypothetical protein